MIGTTFLSYTSLIGIVKEQLYQNDNVFVSTYEPSDTSKLSTSATRAHESNQYMSPDDSIENIHPCAFIAKLQANQKDNTIYGDILKCSTDEFKM